MALLVGGWCVSCFILPASSLSAEQFYFSATCLSEITLSDACNVSFHSQSLAVRFLDGRNVRIPYDSILRWNYTDATRTRMDYELASQIGLIGLLFRRVTHKHVFSITYLDGFGDKQSLILNFADTQYVLPLKSLFSEYAPGKEIRV